MKTDREWRIVHSEVSPAMHMALDEVITNRVAGDARPTLRLWEWETPAVVIGRFQSVRDEVFEDMAENYGVQIVRRDTGGGAMFTEPQRVITYSLSLPEAAVESTDIVKSYRELENWSIAALNDLGVTAEHKPINDIVNGEQKIGGSAQARRSNTVLHHTMMAYDMDVAKMLKILRIGKEKISDKAIQSAEKRVSPISEQVDIPREEVIDAMIEQFAEGRSISEESVKQDELGTARQLVKEKYGTKDWTYKVDREIEDFQE